MNDVEPADVLCATNANVQYFSIPVCYSGTYRVSEGGRVSEKQYMNREHLKGSEGSATSSYY